MPYINTANEAWIQVLKDVAEYGAFVEPRGQKTLEVLGYASRFDMRKPLVTYFNRFKEGRGFKFMAAEAAWILSGDNKVSTIAPFSNEIAKFSDDGEIFFGAYGPKITDQMNYVIRQLVADRDTRQAVLTIWRENPGPSKDIPCTVSIQWFIRGNKLHCIDTMRSSDAWLGWVFDVFNFTMLSAWILLGLRELGVYVELGTLQLQAGSQHIYERNLLQVQEVLENPSHADYPDFAPGDWFLSPKDLVSALWDAARTQGVLNMFYRRGEVG